MAWQMPYFLSNLHAASCELGYKYNVVFTTFALVFLLVFCIIFISSKLDVNAFCEIYLP